MINVKKTKWMVIGRKDTKTTVRLLLLQIDNEIIENVECIKYLGVLIDDRISFEKQIQTCTNKMAKKVNLSYRISDKIDFNTKKLIYNSIIAPSIEQSSVQQCSFHAIIMI